jgi:CHAT domain-containing protein
MDTSLHPPLVRFRWRASRLICAVLLLGLSGLLACGGPEPPSGVSPVRAKLARKLGEARFSEARWTGGFAHAPYKPAPDRLTLTSEARELGQEMNAQGNDTPRAVSDRALVKLLEGKVEEAASSMEAYAKEGLDDGHFLSDLSAVLVERSRRLRQPEDLIPALVAAEKAVQAAPSSPEARFNLALIFDRLGLRTKAMEAWKRYLQIDGGSGWAKEARERLAAFDRPTEREAWKGQLEYLENEALRGNAEAVRRGVTRSPQLARLHVEEKLLSTWAAASIEGRQEEARRALQKARIFAAVIEQVTGDPLLRHSVQTIDQASAGPDRKRLGALLRGHQEHAAGFQKIREMKFPEALIRFRAAQDQLAAGGSPFVAWSRFYEGICDYQLIHYEQMVADLSRLVEDLKQSPYQAVRASALGMLGLVDAIEGDPTSSLRAYYQALAGFVALHETAYAAKTHSEIATTLAYVGDERKAWEHLHQALLMSQAFGGQAIYHAFEEAALATLRLGEPAVALYFQDEVLRDARTSKDPIRVSEALRGRAGIHKARSDARGAMADLVEAERVAGEIPDGEVRNSILGDILLVHGELERPSAPRRAIEFLDQAVEILKKTDYRYLLARGLVERGLAFAAIGENDRAEADFAAAVEESERQRERVDGRHRSSFLDSQQAGFQESILFQIDTRNDPDRAFRHAERRRARALLDALLSLPGKEVGELAGAGPVRPLGVEELLRELPPDVVLVEYVAVRDRLFAWTFLDGASDWTEIRVEGPSIADSVERLLAAIQDRKAEEFRTTSSVLYEQLIRPLRPELWEDHSVIFVPDGPLHALPFAALIDQQTGRYLVEDHPIGIAPSATVYVNSLARDRALAGKVKRTLLALGNPAFDSDLFPGLPRLSGAEGEVERLKSLFPGSLPLVGDQATRSAFLEHAGEHEIVHFGGHAVLNTEFPLLSQLLFTPELGDPSRGVLYTRDLLGQRFERTRLMVLAACRTASGRVSPTEGVESLAQPFLAAGVPAVVASLWDVRDEASELFFAAFYKQLRAGYGPMEALQAAQMQMLKRSIDPSEWAGFNIVGGILHRE